MTNRRRFLTQGTLATCVFTLFNPLDNLNAVFGAPLVSKKLDILTILHGNNIEHVTLAPTNASVQVLKLTSYNLEIDEKTFIVNKNLLSHAIEQKGNAKIGIIYLKESQCAVDNKTQLYNLNKTASFLKERQDCHLVICVVGNENDSLANTLSIEKMLASLSTSIDVIACRKNDELKHGTFVAHNAVGHEVFINAAIGDSVGKIDISFNTQIKKTNIA